MGREIRTQMAPCLTGLWSGGLRFFGFILLQRHAGCVFSPRSFGRRLDILLAIRPGFTDPFRKQYSSPLRPGRSFLKLMYYYAPPLPSGVIHRPIRRESQQGGAGRIRSQIITAKICLSRYGRGNSHRPSCSISDL